jgi:hypothetical protein
MTPGQRSLLDCRNASLHDALPQETYLRDAGYDLVSHLSVLKANLYYVTVRSIALKTFDCSHTFVRSNFSTRPKPPLEVVIVIAVYKNDLTP